MPERGTAGRGGRTGSRGADDGEAKRGRSGATSPPARKADATEVTAETKEARPRGCTAWLKTWPGIVGTLLGIIVAAAAVWKLLVPHIYDADVRLDLTVCQPNVIVLEVTNSGGRAARVGPPTFRFQTSRRDREIRLDSYLANDSDGDGRVDIAAQDAAGVGPVTLVYRNDLDFFSRQESEGPCRVEVTLPVDGGASVQDDCPCEYPH